MVSTPMLLVAASCVPASGINMAGPPETFAAVPAAAVQVAPPEWAKLAPGVPYKVLAKQVVAAEPFTAEAQAEDDRLRSLDCLTQAIYYEAASESEDGQRAVAQVVLNRVRHRTYPNSVCGVVYQGSHLRTGCQFTFTCDGSLRRQPTAWAWARARRIAAEALSGEVYAPVGNATHYHTTSILPYWASSLTRAAVVGAHIFYRWRGSQGTPAAFTQRYAGVEPGTTAPAAVTSKEAPVMLAAAEIVEGGVRKWNGSTPQVRIHRGSLPSPARNTEPTAPTSEAPVVEAAAEENFGIKIHRGAADTTS